MLTAVSKYKERARKVQVVTLHISVCLCAEFATAFVAVSGVEDPEKMLDQTVNEMQEDLIKMRQASAQVLASQKQIENKYNQAQTTAVRACTAVLRKQTSTCFIKAKIQQDRCSVLFMA